MSSAKMTLRPVESAGSTFCTKGSFFKTHRWKISPFTTLLSIYPVSSRIAGISALG